MMIEMGCYELVDFCERWRVGGKEGAAFREQMQSAFEWSIKHGIPIDIVQAERERKTEDGIDTAQVFAVQATLRDARGAFFTELVLPRGNLDMGARLSAAVQAARKKRIGKLNRREPSKRAA